MDPVQAFIQQMMAQGQPQPQLPPPTPGGVPAQTGPQIFGPSQGSNIGTGKQVGAWTNPFTDANAVNSAEFTGGAMPGVAAGSVGSPYWKALLAAAGVMQPTPTAANDTIGPLAAGARPQHPASTGMMPSAPPDFGGGGWTAPADINLPPMDVHDSPPMPARPTSTPGGQVAAPLPDSPPLPPARPAYPLPPARPADAAPPKKKIDPKSVDLNQGGGRFGTFQYGVPSGRGPLANNPIYTDLNLFGGS